MVKHPPPKPQSVSKTDIKGYFQDLQSVAQQEGLGAVESNPASPDSIAESRSNDSPVGNTQHSTTDLERTIDSPSWDMQAYIKSLPTREDMDKYVYRLETSYKAEIQALKTSLVDTQSKVDIEFKMAAIDQKMLILEEEKKTGT